MILVTGAAGFIGFHVAERLLRQGEQVFGVDNLNDYYDPTLKAARLGILQGWPNFRFERVDIADGAPMARLFADVRPSRVVHLAAQPGVRYSLENPHAYTTTNVTGFLNVLEGCRHNGVEHLVYASTSSVYGANRKQPFSEHDSTEHPVSLYAATKKANEMMAHVYAHLFRLPCTGLRFFTVYGPWGRPDMALFKFTKLILRGDSIPVFNEGRMVRDFTFIDDIADAVVRVCASPATGNASWDGRDPDPATSEAPYRIYNIGNGDPQSLLRYIEVLESALGRKAQTELLPLQPGDVLSTAADVSELDAAIGFRPATPIETGVRRFVEWYREYYKV